MILTTTPSIEGPRIKEYRGVIAGEAIIGANIFRDMFAAVTDIVGGRSGAYEGALKSARESAFAELEAAAANVGANAVVGVDIDYEMIGKAGSMMMVSVSGTAVVLE